MADGVPSNVVGYNTTGVLADTMTMIGINFDDINGGGAGISIQKAFMGSFNGGEDLSSSDNLIVWTPSGYKSYYFGYWGDPSFPEWDNLWYDFTTGDEAAAFLKPGDAVWYVRRGAATPVTAVGEVLPTNKTIPVLANTMTMFASTHPKAVKLNGGLDVLNPIGGEDLSSSDNLIIWTPAGYKSYYFGYWGDPSFPEWDNLWYDFTTGDEADVSLEVGQAAWYVRRGGATTITFAAPAL